MSLNHREPVNIHEPIGRGGGSVSKPRGGCSKWGGQVVIIISKTTHGYVTNTENTQWIKLQILHDNVYNQDIRTDPDGQIIETFLHGQIIE